MGSVQAHGPKIANITKSEESVSFDPSGPGIQTETGNTQKLINTTFDGMAPGVMPPGPTQLGTFPLQAGKRRVSLMIVGKHAQSTGHFVGIDKLRLYPAGPIS